MHPGITRSEHSLAVLIPAYGRPLTIFEKIKTTFRWPFFAIPVDSHRGSGGIVPQQNYNLSSSITDGHKSMEDTMSGLGHTALGRSE